MAFTAVDISTNKLKELQMVDGRLMVNVDRVGSGGGGPSANVNVTNNPLDVSAVVNNTVDVSAVVNNTVDVSAVVNNLVDVSAVVNNTVDVSAVVNNLVDVSAVVNNTVDVSNNALTLLESAINNDMVDVSVGNTVNVNITGGSTSGTEFVVGGDLPSDASGTLFLGVTGDNSFNYVAVDASGRLEINDINATLDVSAVVNNTVDVSAVVNNTVDVSAVVNNTVDVSAVVNNTVDVSAVVNNIVDVSNNALTLLESAINNDMVDVSVGNTVNVNITGGSTSGTEFAVGGDLPGDASGTLMLGVTEDNSFNYVAVDNSGHLQVDIRSQRMAVQEITTAPDVSFSSNKIDSSVNFTVMDFNIENFKDFSIYITGDVSGSVYYNESFGSQGDVSFNVNNNLDVCGQISFNGTTFIDLTENYFLRPYGLDNTKVVWNPNDVVNYSPMGTYSSVSGFKGLPADGEGFIGLSPPSAGASSIYSILTSYSFSSVNSSYNSGTSTNEYSPFFVPHFKKFRMKVKLANRGSLDPGDIIDISGVEIVDLSGSIFSKS